MNGLKICALALICLALLAVIRQLSCGFTMSLRTAVLLGAGFAVLAAASPVISFLKELMGNAGMSVYAETIIKGLGISFLTGGCASVCRDSGEGGLAGYVELAGKLEIFVLCIPMINEILGAAELLLGEK